ncbi:hypothetical protein IMG5_062560 [Ichthyophthirius multifiliis]|uniref:Transmembrane protein n=1 Tax=Ichthyophthirius multifiliis TaxID=5932 RepID=G0QNZ1_ICHMU|nr:hypothetical protein IMG5_062560 [Ichthyophthirius multifiliis]EGR33078.1 hypothetical protein IMG5_062560 [Ichthyophthirius multifiliis]|eukprot:XP_004037064.1 hypothetical protein IMG5_062560 [Ichthyophthirius multifiliis]
MEFTQNSIKLKSNYKKKKICLKIKQEEKYMINIMLKMKIILNILAQIINLSIYFNQALFMLYFCFRVILCYRISIQMFLNGSFFQFLVHLQLKFKLFKIIKGLVILLILFYQKQLFITDQI